MGADDTIASTMLSSGIRPVGGATVLDRELREGDVLGSYQLERLLGEGAMGQVFQARHMRLGRQVALKVLRPAFAHDGTFVQRFFQEARAVNQINHEHIVEIFDFVEDAHRGHVYCVMELLRGQSLSALLKEEQLTVARIRRLVVQLCAALGAAHQLGVVHRDIKPDNLFVTHRGGQADFLKVLDFGVAKVLTAEGTSGTLDGTIIGTPTYMSPEQAAGLPVDQRADIYAVGTVLYEMLSGQPPFQAPNFGQLVVKVITESPPPLPSHTPSGEGVPRALAQLTLRCLAKDPEDRPRQLSEVMNALLADVGPEPVTAVEDCRPTQKLPVTGGWSRRAWLMSVAGALALLGGGLVLGLETKAEGELVTAVASPHAPAPVAPSVDEVRLDSPPTLEVPPVPVEARPSRRETVRPAAHRKQKADTRERDNVIDPFAR